MTAKRPPVGAVERWPAVERKAEAVARAADDPLHGEQPVVEPDRREQGGDRDVEPDREAVSRHRERHSVHEHAAGWSVRPQVSCVDPDRQVRTRPVAGSCEYDSSVRYDAETESVQRDADRPPEKLPVFVNISTGVLKTGRIFATDEAS